MGGGYIECGEFSGEDKSASALDGVIGDLQALLRWESKPRLIDLLTEMRAFMSGDGMPPQEWHDAIEITADEIADLQPYLEKCRDTLVAELGTDDPTVAMDAEQATSGLSSSELKWGKGAGWRLYCVADLLRAAAHAKTHNENVTISFD